jgi:hypothetical protein
MDAISRRSRSYKQLEATSRSYKQKEHDNAMKNNEVTSDEGVNEGCRSMAAGRGNAGAGEEIDLGV